MQPLGLNGKSQILETLKIQESSPMITLFNEVYNGKKVLITGHTGFKGSWLCMLLNKLGADVYGYSLDPPTNPSLFTEAKIERLITSFIGDIRDYDKLLKVIQIIQPEIVFHMAAQPLVLESYKIPIETYSINVMGTVHLLEACRQTKSVKAIVNVTTDKCYENREWLWGYREVDQIGGYDPYSNSKGCSELITTSYRRSYFNPSKFNEHGVAIATVRAGNVIGGGDWAADRLIPDSFRSIICGEKIKIRNPYAIRPWQHVLEALTGYLTLCEKLYIDGPTYADAWNFGPDDKDVQNVEWIIRIICNRWGKGASFEIDSYPQPYESNYLKLDCSKARSLLNWQPKWNINKTIDSIIEWYKVYIGGGDIKEICNKQINEFIYE